MTRTGPAVAAIVLNWNNYEDTAETLAGLKGLDYDALKLIVVDNGSTDTSSNRLEHEFPEAEFIYNEQNLGFPGGNNVGIREALNQGFDYVWILNNDLVIPGDFDLKGLVSVTKSHSAVGAISPILTEYPERNRIWFRRGYIDRRSGVTEHEEHHRWFLTLGEVRPYGPERELADGVVTTDYMPLCAALVSRNVFEDIGLLTEDYFLYGSDVDFFLRAWNAGHVSVTDTRKQIHHKVSASSDSDTGATISYYAGRNRILLRRRFPEVFAWSGNLLYWWWLALHFGYRILNNDPGSGFALLRGALDGLRDRSGRGPYP